MCSFSNQCRKIVFEFSRIRWNNLLKFRICYYRRTCENHSQKWAKKIRYQNQQIFHYNSAKMKKKHSFVFLSFINSQSYVFSHNDVKSTILMTYVLSKINVLIMYNVEFEILTQSNVYISWANIELYMNYCLIEICLKFSSKNLWHHHRFFTLWYMKSQFYQWSFRNDRTKIHMNFSKSYIRDNNVKMNYSCFRLNLYLRLRLSKNLILQLRLR